MRATIRPTGVGINPPMAGWIRPSSVSRARWALGITLLLLKLRATSSSEVNSAEVRSSALGKRFMRRLLLSGESGCGVYHIGGYSCFISPLL
jgi:hypothetical protein